MESLDHYMRAFGQAIQAQRSREGLSLDAAAGRWGLEPTALAALERGEANPGFESLLRLAQGMAVSPAELFDAAQRLADADADDG